MWIEIWIFWENNWKFSQQKSGNVQNLGNKIGFIFCWKNAFILEYFWHLSLKLYLIQLRKKSLPATRFSSNFRRYYIIVLAFFGGYYYVILGVVKSWNWCITFTSISSYILYFQRFQNKFTIVYPFLLIFLKRFL